MAAQAVLTAPAPATVLAGTVVPFTWTAGTGNTTGYSLWLGSTGVGSNHLYQSRHRKFGQGYTWDFCSSTA